MVNRLIFVTLFILGVLNVQNARAGDELPFRIPDAAIAENFEYLLGQTKKIRVVHSTLYVLVSSVTSMTLWTSSDAYWTGIHTWSSSATFQDDDFSIGGTTFTVANGIVSIGGVDVMDWISSIAIDTGTLEGWINSTGTALTSLTNAIATDTTTLTGWINSTGTALTLLTNAIATDTATLTTAINSTGTALTLLTIAVAADTATLTTAINSTGTALTTLTVAVAASTATLEGWINSTGTALTTLTEVVTTNLGYLNTTAQTLTLLIAATKSSTDTIAADLDIVEANMIWKSSDVHWTGVHTFESSVTVNNIVSATRYDIEGSTVLAILPGAESLGIGTNAGRLNTGDYNIFIGSAAGYSNTSGESNVFIGNWAGYDNTIGKDNTFVGRYSGTNMETGNDNTFTGRSAGAFNETGLSNTLVGSEAGYGNFGDSYSSSTMVGFQAGYSVTTGNNNLFHGFRAGDNVTTGSNNIIIGYDLDAPSVSTSNYLSIGDLIYGDIDDGKVGIGQPNPTAALEILNGGILISTTSGSHGITFQDNSEQILAYAPVFASSEPVHSPSIASTAYIGIATATITNRGGRPLKFNACFTLSNLGAVVRIYTISLRENGVEQHAHTHTTGGNDDASVNVFDFQSSSTAGVRNFAVLIKSNNAAQPQTAKGIHLLVQEK